MRLKRRGTDPLKEASPPFWSHVSHKEGRVGRGERKGKERNGNCRELYRANWLPLSPTCIPRPSDAYVGGEGRSVCSSTRMYVY
jgi:hypothetical protein